MGERLDLLRSLVRAGADRAGAGLRRLVPTESLRRGLAQLRDQRVVIGQAPLARALAHTPGVRDASVGFVSGRLHMDVRLDGDRTLAVAFQLEGARFAPRGAKEVHLRVEPPEVARDPAVVELAGTLAGVIAHAVWGFALGEPDADVSGAIVERSGPSTLRVDLRTVPAVRRAQTRGPLALLMDAMDVRALEVTDAGLAVTLKLPSLAG